MFVYLRVYVRARVYVCVNKNVHMYVCAYKPVCVVMHVRICVSICMFA